MNKIDNEIMTLGEKLKTIRRDAGITQAEMAKIIGIGEKTLWNYENNKRLISFEHLSKMAEILNIDISEFKNNNLNDIFNEDIKETLRAHMLYDFNSAKYTKKIRHDFYNGTFDEEDFNNNHSKALTVILELLYHDRLQDALGYNVRDFKEENIIESSEYILKAIELAILDLEKNSRK